MASDFEVFCNALVADLTTNVPGLALDAERIHTLWPADPETYAAAVGERHLSVWPAAQAESSAPQGVFWRENTTTYIIQVWEGVDSDASRLIQDQAAISAFLQLHNDIRARLFKVATEVLADARLVEYQRTQFPTAPGSVRWFAISLTAKTPMNFT